MNFRNRFQQNNVYMSVTGSYLIHSHPCHLKHKNMNNTDSSGILNKLYEGLCDKKRIYTEFGTGVLVERICHTHQSIKICFLYIQQVIKKLKKIANVTLIGSLIIVLGKISGGIST